MQIAILFSELRGVIHNSSGSGRSSRSTLSELSTEKPNKMMGRLQTALVLLTHVFLWRFFDATRAGKRALYQGKRLFSGTRAAFLRVTAFWRRKMCALERPHDYWASTTYGRIVDVDL